MSEDVPASDTSTLLLYGSKRNIVFSNSDFVCNRMSRDNARTPMQWSDEPNAGFTTGTPWLKVNENYKNINVASQENASDSVLNYYRSLIALRKFGEYKNVFTYGEFIPVYQDTDSIMAYYRKDEDKQILIAANFGEAAVSISLEHPARQVLLSNTGKSEIASPELKLDSCEVIVVEV